MKTRQTRLYALAFVSLALIASACNRGAQAQSTPTLAYKQLYEAVKKKDTEGIKKTLSKGTLALMQDYAQMQKQPFEKVIENGLTETTFAPKLPQTRNEKITGDVALLEVKNEKTGGWDALPFAKEDGQWKLAIDTFFKGTMSPNGPTNPEHPGELPPGAKPGTPQQNPNMPGRKPLQQPGAPAPDTAQPPGAAQPAPTTGGKQEPPKKGIKPPTKD